MSAVRQRQPRYINPKLTRLAKHVPCMFTFQHYCHGASMPCHSNWQVWGKGVGLKSHDWAFAAGCSNAHDAIDNKLNRTLSQDERHYYWLEAFVSTQTYLWDNGLVRVA